MFATMTMHSCIQDNVCDNDNALVYSRYCSRQRQCTRVIKIMFAKMTMHSCIQENDRDRWRTSTPASRSSRIAIKCTHVFKVMFVNDDNALVYSRLCFWAMTIHSYIQGYDCYRRQCTRVFEIMFATTTMHSCIRNNVRDRWRTSISASRSGRIAISGLLAW